MNLQIFTCIVVLLISANLAYSQKINFDYLKIKKNSVKTTHSAKYTFKIKKPFKFLGEYHHQPTYGKKQFNVSMAVFSSGENILIIHAETHTDGSDGLDYSNLSPIKLSKLDFTTREQCASEDDSDELNANPQIRFIRNKGFEMNLPFYLKQFFTTSSDGKAEVVLSYGRKVNSCDNVPDDFKTMLTQEAGKNIRIKKQE